MTESHFYAFGVYFNKNNLTVKDNEIAEKYLKYLLKLLFILKKQYVT